MRELVPVMSVSPTSGARACMLRVQLVQQVLGAGREDACMSAGSSCSTAPPPAAHQLEDSLDDAAGEARALPVGADEQGVTAQGGVQRQRQVAGHLFQVLKRLESSALEGHVERHDVAHRLLEGNRKRHDAGCRQVAAHQHHRLLVAKLNHPILHGYVGVVCRGRVAIACWDAVDANIVGIPKVDAVGKVSALQAASDDSGSERAWSSGGLKATTIGSHGHGQDCGDVCCCSACAGGSIGGRDSSSGGGHAATVGTAVGATQRCSGTAVGDIAAAHAVQQHSSAIHMMNCGLVYGR